MFDGRKGLFSCWNDVVVDKHSTIELWQCFSLSVHQLFSSLLSPPPSPQFPPLLRSEEKGSGLMGWFVEQEEGRKLISSFFFFFNTLNAEIIKFAAIGEGEGMGGGVRKGYQKGCGKVGLFKCSSLGLLYKRFTSASDALFASPTSVGGGGGRRVGEEEEFVNPLAVAVRGKVAGDLFSSLLDALSTLSSLNEDEDFVLALQWREEGREAEGLEGDVATKMEIFLSLSRLCDFVESQVTALTAPPAPLPSSTKEVAKNDAEMEDAVSATAVSLPPLPPSSSTPVMTEENFQFHPQIVSVVDDILSLRHELDVHSSLIHALLTGDANMDSDDVDNVEETPKRFHFLSKKVQDVIGQYLSVSVGKMVSRPPTDFVAFQHLFWRCSSPLVDTEGEEGGRREAKEEKRRMGELMALLMSFQKRLWDIPFSSVLSLLKEAQKVFFRYFY